MTKLFRSLREAEKSPLKVQALKLTLPAGTGIGAFASEFPNLEELYLEGDCEDFEFTQAFSKLRLLSLKLPNFKGEVGGAFRLGSLKILKVIETPIRTFSLPLGLSRVGVESITLKGCGLARLPEEISLLGQLRELSLPQNALDALPETFSSLTSLQRLNLDQNHFRSYPGPLEAMPSLKHLSIDGNPFPQEERDRIQRRFHIWVK